MIVSIFKTLDLTLDQAWTGFINFLHVPYENLYNILKFIGIWKRLKTQVKDFGILYFESKYKVGYWHRLLHTFRPYRYRYFKAYL